MSESVTITRVENTFTVAASGPQGIPGPGVPAGGSTGQVLTKSSNTDYATAWATPSGGGGGGSGTVTSVALTVPSIFSLSGSPITTAGTFAITLATQAANQVWCGPTGGAAAAPTFRALVAADLPSHSHILGDVTGLNGALASIQADVDSKATIISPTFTGVPLAPTASAGTNTTQIATTAYVRGEVAALVASAPGTLDTLNELATALGSDPNFATTMTSALAGKAATSHTHNASDINAGTLSFTRGGTGQVTLQAALNSLATGGTRTLVKGDLFVFNGTDVVIIAKGSDGYHLESDSTQATGLRWVTSGTVLIPPDVFNEVPAGTVNGSNAVFTTAETPVAASVRVFKNGLRQTLTVDYTIATETITFVAGNIPQTGDRLLVDYKSAGS